MREPSARKLGLAAALVLLGVLVPALAWAHIERASYWPNPAPDTSVSPAAGGKVPAYRSLFSALRKSPPGRTRVVCQGAVPSKSGVRRAKRKLRAGRRAKVSARESKALTRRLKLARRKYRRAVRVNPSMQRLGRSIAAARRDGYTVRPTERRSLGKKRAKRLRRFNERLLAVCRFHEIQPAITRSRNNDRVVVMPGVYTEPTARAQPTDDPKCRDLRQGFANDEGQIGAVKYAYQAKCPNDANLIAVIGQTVGSGNDPQPPLWDRHVIPNAGHCIRCNLQLEGSGVGPDDVIVDAGRVASGNRGPLGSKKDVGIRADRADGFVLTNMTVRHAKEHDVYILETDGYLLERFKVFWGGEYGLLTFVSDHGLIQDCEAAGSGDSGLYPGSSPETGEQTIEAHRRYGQELRHCDMHHNVTGYSGTDSNAVHIHDNNFYDNALGLTTDVLTGSGHPGFPQDSSLIEHNRFYSNNFNPYLPNTDVNPVLAPAPVGTGMWILGGNNNTVRDNRFWDNWRRGAMLLAIPDAFICGPAAENNQQKGCVPGGYSTSYRNRFYRNVMSRDPQGRRDPNGLDFWWDQGGIDPPTPNTANCWYDNTGVDGTPASVTSTPPRWMLPSDCAHSLAPGGYVFGQVAEVANCFVDYSVGTGTCGYFKTPREPN